MAAAVRSGRELIVLTALRLVARKEEPVTKEEKADCIVELSHPYGRVTLLCDGRKVAICERIRREIKMRFPWGLSKLTGLTK
jgi:hypothetical protein